MILITLAGPHAPATAITTDLQALAKAARLAEVVPMVLPAADLAGADAAPPAKSSPSTRSKTSGFRPC